MTLVSSSQRETVTERQEVVFPGNVAVFEPKLNNTYEKLVFWRINPTRNADKQYIKEIT